MPPAPDKATQQERWQEIIALLELVDVGGFNGVFLVRQLRLIERST